MVILASGEVINESFLQEHKIISKDMISSPEVFINIKNKAKS